MKSLDKIMKTFNKAKRDLGEYSDACLKKAEDKKAQVFKLKGEASKAEDILTSLLGLTTEE